MDQEKPDSSFNEIRSPLEQAIQQRLENALNESVQIAKIFNSVATESEARRIVVSNANEVMARFLKKVSWDDVDNLKKYTEKRQEREKETSGPF